MMNDSNAGVLVYSGIACAVSILTATWLKCRDKSAGDVYTDIITSIVCFGIGWSWPVLIPVAIIYWVSGILHKAIVSRKRKG